MFTGDACGRPPASPTSTLYVSLFPQLVAGPIERGAHLLPQILKPRHPTLDGFYSGAQLAFVGLFKKLVIADNMAVLVNSVYGPGEPCGAAVLLGTYAFALQIYCDFSGYTDIARGTARMLGFDICENFRLALPGHQPERFLAALAHQPLVLAARLPLHPAGRQPARDAADLRNLVLTMLLGGLWHGAAWTLRRLGRFPRTPSDRLPPGRDPAAGTGADVRSPYGRPLLAGSGCLLPPGLFRVGALPSRRHDSRGAAAGCGRRGNVLGAGLRPHAADGGGGRDSPGRVPDLSVLPPVTRAVDRMAVDVPDRFLCGTLLRHHPLRSAGKQ